MRFITIILLFAASCASTASKGETSYLFVQNADRAVLRDGKLTLQGVGENVVFFSDRPVRLSGHAPTHALLGGWEEGKGSFAATPPNAVLSIYHAKGVVDVTVVLRNPRRTGKDVTFDVDVLDGPASARGGPAALFIDNLANWPVERHGMHDEPHAVERRGMHSVK